MKKIIINVVLILVAYVAPIYYFDLHQNDSRIIDSIQVPVFIFFFIGAILLTYLNYKNRKQALEKKWIWAVFEIIGVIGVLYAGAILLILFSFRHGIGF